MTQNEYNAYLAQIQAGQVAHVNGHDVATQAELDIVRNYGATVAFRAVMTALEDSAGNVIDSSLLGSARGLKVDIAGIGGSQATTSNPLPMFDGYQSPVSSVWNSATALNTAASVITSGYDTVCCSVIGTGQITAGAVIFEVYDGASWLPIKAARIESYLTDQGYSLIGNPSGSRAWQIPVAGFPQFRVRLSTAIVGAGSTNITLIQSSAPDTSIVTAGIDPSIYPLPMTGSNLEVAFTTTTVQAVASTDVSAYGSVSVHVTGQGTSSTVNFQGSNDNVNWVPVYLQPIAAGTAPVTSVTTTGIWAGQLPFRYFRLNVTGISAGTTAGVVEFFSVPRPPGGVFALASVPLQNQSNAGVNIVLGTSSVLGSTPYSNTALSNTAVAVKASACNLYGYHFYNPNGSVVYVQFFNLGTGSVTLGTTTPTFVVAIPAGQVVDVCLAAPTAFTSAMSIAATTTPTGSTAPGTALVSNVRYL